MGKGRAAAPSSGHLTYEEWQSQLCYVLSLRVAHLYPLHHGQLYCVAQIRVRPFHPFS